MRDEWLIKRVALPVRASVVPVYSKLNALTPVRAGILEVHRNCGNSGLLGYRDLGESIDEIVKQISRFRFDVSIAIGYIGYRLR